MRSALLISSTLVSNDPWRVRALQRSFASKNARPNSLHTGYQRFVEFSRRKANVLSPYVTKVKGASYSNNDVCSGRLF